MDATNIELPGPTHLRDRSAETKIGFVSLNRVVSLSSTMRVQSRSPFRAVRAKGLRKGTLLRSKLRRFTQCRHSRSLHWSRDHLTAATGTRKIHKHSEGAPQRIAPVGFDFSK